MVDQNLFEAVRKSFSMVSPKLLPGPSFRLSNRRGCDPLGLSVPISCFQSPTGKKGPIGLLLQLDGFPHHWCPPAGSGIAAVTGTDHLTARTPVHIWTPLCLNMVFVMDNP